MAALASSSLALAAPAALAAGAYLDAKFGLSRDLGLIRAVYQSQWRTNRYINDDRLNAYYVLQDQATNPATRDKPMLIFEGRHYTYHQAHEHVLRYAQWLKKECGVVRDEIIAMDVPNKPEFIWMAYGLFSLGAKPALINYNLGGEALLHCVKTSTARLLLVDADVEANLTDDVRSTLAAPDFRPANKGPVEVVMFNAAAETRIAAYDAVLEPNSCRDKQTLGHTGCLIYTSGTTGFPKAANVSWSKINRANGYMPQMIGLKTSDRFYTGMPLYHSAAMVLGLSNCIAVGATLVLSRRFSATNFWKEVHASEATMIQYVGEVLRYLLAAPPSPLDKGHKVHTAYGNGLRPDIWNTFKERFGIATIAEFYGATESPVAFLNVSSNALTEGAIGRSGPLIRTLFNGQNAFVKLDPESDEPIRDPKTGLCIRIDRATGEVGECVALLPDNIVETYQGYHGNQSATDSKILRNVLKKGDAFFRTGDIMRSDTEGRIYFVDRIGDTFRWKSENVSTFEVQEAVNRHPSVKDSTVYGVALPAHDGRAGCAAVVFKDGAGSASGETLASLAAHLAKSLPGYARPLFIREVQEIEVTGTGKHVKHKLRVQGVQPDKVRGSGDRLLWLRGGTYVPFGDDEWRSIERSAVKL